MSKKLSKNKTNSDLSKKRISSPNNKIPSSLSNSKIPPSLSNSKIPPNLDKASSSLLNSKIHASDTDIFEGMVSVRSVFEGIDKKISNRKIISVLFSESRTVGNGKLMGFLKARSFVYGYEFCVVSEEIISGLASGSSHGGVIMLCEKRIYPEKVTAPAENGFYVLLDGIEDPYNLGYAIRSAYAAGADGIILPKRSPLVSAGTVCRASAGSSELIETVLGSPTEIVTELKKKGYRLAVADMDAPSPAHLSNLKKPIILAVGGEKRGFSKALSELSDIKIRLDYGRDFPMALSASSAAAILSFEVTKQNQ